MPSQWLELSTEAPGEYAEPLTHLFARYGEGGVVVEEAGGYNPDEGETPPTDAPVIVRAYLPIDATTDDRRARIDMGLRLISYLHPIPPLKERVLKDREWELQEFEPVRVGERLVIAPEGSTWDDTPDDIVIKLDPGLAFGTGHHPTTRMCMLYLENTVLQGCKVLDLGCGSGILTLTAFKLGAGSVAGLDIEADAIKSSNENLGKNGLAGKANFRQGSLPNPIAPDGTFDIAVANISANVLIALAPLILASLAPGGVFVGSGLLAERKDEVEAAVNEAGAEFTDLTISGDWAAFTAVVHN
ncbi:MAG: 50S ribosomal protein L11 methyltransferase [Dehalococcoidia bacterium]|jgi:ribosomal protein L11 methyltransferase|nr:50S ribosomal protein L11 methyltransferase [Dehalococcoidia bacterium]